MGTASPRGDGLPIRTFVVGKVNGLTEWWQAVGQQMLSRKELIQTAQAKARANGAPRRVQALSQHDWDA